MAEGSYINSILNDPVTLIGLGAIAAGTLFYLYTRPSPIMSKIPLDNQSLELPGGVRQSHLVKDGKLVTTFYDGIHNLYDCFQRGKTVSKDGPCLGWRTSANSGYEWISYSQVEGRAHAFGAGTSHLGVEPGQKSFIGIYAPNCVEWVVVEQSCNMFSRVLVPLYDTLGPDVATFIINLAEISVVVCDKSKMSLLLKQVPSCPSLKHIIKFGSAPTDSEMETAKGLGVTLLPMEEVEKSGRENPKELCLPSADDIATVCFTSGTTGNPKGVMISHGNVVAELSGVMAGVGLHFDPSDVYISYLPLAHMMERCVQAMCYLEGVRVGFFRGDVKELLSDIKELKPTIFVSVPRLLNRVYDKVLQGVNSSAVKKLLFNQAFSAKLREIRRGIVRNNSIWDYLVFRKVQQSLGGRVRMVVTGSAPISAKVMDFLRVSFGCMVFEGYGQTECTAGATITTPGDCLAGHVGVPFPCCCIKLVDIPDMNYFSANNEGEVCVKGPIVFKGYLKDQTKTDEALDKDGWLHTGDVGCWLPNGTLKIIDRKKHIFKLSQGEYIAPEKLEGVYMRCELVAQVFVYGDSLKSCCVAVVVPDEEVLVKWARDGGRGETFQELCQQEEVKKMIITKMTETGKENGFLSFEQPKAIMLFPEGFSVENSLLTPTFKLKRPEVKKHFMKDIVQLYAQVPS